MNFEKLLTETIFNTSEIAARLYPELTRGSAKNRLHSKVNNVDGRNLTAADKERLKEIWEKLKREIDGDIEE